MRKLLYMGVVVSMLLMLIVAATPAMAAPLCPLPYTTSISPTSKNVGDGGFTLYVHGTSFESTSVVRFNGSDRTTIHEGSTLLMATIPASDMIAAGTFNITVFNPAAGGCESNAQTFTVNNLVPTTTSIEPTSKNVGDSGFYLWVYGTNFDLYSPAVVRFNGSDRTTTVHWVGPNPLMAWIPASDMTAAGTFNITVFNPAPGGGESNPQTFTVNNLVPTPTSIIPAPTISSFNPSSGGTGTWVTITGTGFYGGGSSPAVSVVKFGGTDASSFTVNSDTQITAVVGNGTTTGVISVTTPCGTVAPGGAIFTFIPLTISGFTPGSGGTGTWVTITGTGFYGCESSYPFPDNAWINPWVSVVKFGGTAASSFTADSPTQITAVVGNGATGPVSVTTRHSGPAVSTDTFTFTPTPASTPMPTPVLPCRFYGTVLVNGEKVTDGTIITITVGSDAYTTTTTTVAGVSSYSYTVNPSTSYANGTPVTFKIAGTVVTQTATWTNGSNVEVDLTAATITPPLPCRFYGTVLVKGQNVADGTVITATIGNDTYTTTTTTAAGASTYRITIAQPGNENYDGLTVAFKIGSATADQTGIWQTGMNVLLNLTSAPVPTPTPVPTPMPTTPIPTLELARWNCDKNQDGYISKSELSHAIRGLFAPISPPPSGGAPGATPTRSIARIHINVAQLMDIAQLYGRKVSISSFTTTPMVSAGVVQTVGLKRDGRVVATGGNASGECNVRSWANVTQVAAGAGFTVGLQQVGSDYHNTKWLSTAVLISGAPDVVGGSWFRQVAASDYVYPFAVWVGWNGFVDLYCPQLYSSSFYLDPTIKDSIRQGLQDPSGWAESASFWPHITQVAAGGEHIVGLIYTGGTVVAAGDNTYGQCNVGNWTNIRQVAAGGDHTVGLKWDGTVVATGDNGAEQWGRGAGQCNVGNWTNIRQVAAGYDFTVGLCGNGTVVATGDNSAGQCNVGNWTNITQVAAGNYHTVGLKSDGTVVATGDNSVGQCDVSHWNLEAP